MCPSLVRVGADPPGLLEALSGGNTLPYGRVALVLLSQFASTVGGGMLRLQRFVTILSGSKLH